jgi:hypothetical protein
MAGLNSINGQAGKEAWYSDSYNPFKNNHRGNYWAQTWTLFTPAHIATGLAYSSDEKCQPKLSVIEGN